MNKKNYVAVATLAFAMLTSCAGQKEASVTHVEDGTMHIR